MYSRVWAGRHTLDQVTIGLALGIWSAFFTLEIVLPYIYDPSLQPENKLHQMTYAKFYFAFWIISFIIMCGIYLHVDTHVIIP